MTTAARRVFRSRLTRMCCGPTLWPVPFEMLVPLDRAGTASAHVRTCE